jgi:threonine dehydrogenase-like Zn-dependent dehydrogenase
MSGVGKTMLALVYHGPEDLRVERRPAPAIGAGLIDLAPLVSGRYPLTAGREAFDTARDRRGLKVLFEPGIGG